METPSSDEVTRLLKAWSAGDETALEKLLPLVDDELQKIAHAYLRRERSGQDLDETELVNEALLRFITEPQIKWQDRRQFFAIAASKMREILVDYARRRLSFKRGGRSQAIPLDEVVISITQSETLALLDLALDRLAELDERKSKVVELRYFGGFTMEETAEILGLSVSTVERAWKSAKAWLRQELEPEQRNKLKK
ncbi:MAG TPA: ECF-type sigma factor [Pyrinomonadaceae bacterium]|nr:ECF-type sigma factor [Pyrinomonadaceae bacterium]